MQYPCLMQDEASQKWFIAGEFGPTTWNYHKYRWAAWLELCTQRIAELRLAWTENKP